jgi:flagellar biosynthetic protein FlhB
MAGEKTEKPSPRRLQKAREQGRFLTSRELVAAVQFAAAAYLLTRRSPEWFFSFRQSWARRAEGAFGWAGRDFSLNEAGLLWRDILWTDLAPIWAASLLLVFVALAAQTLVAGFGFATANLAPNFARLNPAGRLKELPAQGLRQAALSVLLLVLFLWMGGAMFGDDAQKFLALGRASLAPGFAFVTASLGGLLEKAAWIFLLLGALDYLRQRQRYRKDLSMTKQELREEAKESDGNPQIKQKVRRLQREYSRRRMMSDVEKATAVIVNPTHYAVAIQYQLASGSAPRVVAKGRNFLALRIRERAQAHQVPIVENPPLARTLYESVAIGQEIPAHLYRAVAEVLAYIFRLLGGRLPGQS